mmetsp:Transcript_65552/g.207305  ORF Transcript_65552/g.207305 Transcript_65552/m.207305 type:complete len:758 (-) Transcript_65552:47-2320(-)
MADTATPTGRMDPPQATVPNMAELMHLTDLHDINRMLHTTIALQRTIDTELEGLLGKRGELAIAISGLDSCAEVMDHVTVDAEVISASVTSTSELADHVSSKVRQLDSAQQRAADTVTQISALVDRSNCVEGVRSAMEGEDWEAAAKYVSTFMQLETSASIKAAATLGDDVAGVAEQQRSIFASKARLEEVVREKFKSAVGRRDHKDVLRFAKLFEPLGLHTEGLNSFAGYLKALVLQRAQEDYQELLNTLEAPEAEAQANFVGVLVNMFNDIATALDENEAMLTSAFGPDAMTTAILVLQQVCDDRGALLLARYQEHRRLQYLVQQVVGGSMGAALGNALGKMGATETVDPREVEGYLEEILMLCQRSEEYNGYMVQRLRDTAAASGTPLLPAKVTSFKSGQFNVAVRSLVGTFISLDEFAMDANVAKAIAIDELIEGNPTSSMVDDVFFVLQRCGHRSVSTANSQCVVAGLTQVNNLLSNTFKEALASNIKAGGGAARLLGCGPGMPSEGVLTQGAREHAAALNGADVSADYVLKLVQALEKYAGEVFHAKSDVDKISSVLADLGKTSGDFRQIASSGLEALAGGINPRLRPLLDGVVGVGYELSEEMYSEYEVNDPWVQALLATMEANLSWMQPLLSQSNYDTLVHHVLDTLVARLEAVMMQKSFNQLGGLQLDRDTRTLVQYLSAITSRTVRDKMARLTQMATILNLESVEEILDYWGENSGPMTWRLTPAEVRKVLGLRGDFKPEAIAALKL